MSSLVSFCLNLALLNLANSYDLTQTKGNPYSLSNIQYSTTGITAIASYSIGSELESNEVIITKLLLNITYDNPQRVRIQITDSQSPRWQVPYDFPQYTPLGNFGLYNITLSQNPMGIQVIRTSDGMVIFNLDPQVFFSYNDQDIYFTNNLGYNINVMGLGERVTSFILQPGTYTMWSNAKDSPYDYGVGVGNMYSMHPFYMIVEEETGTAFGGFFFNSNYMAATVNPTNLGFRTTGGIIDFWVFLGPTPEDVIFQYHTLIGYPTLFPYWSFGWHQCRWGYENITMLSNVLDNYINRSIPLDALWNDIDYMSDYQDFVYNQTSYPLANDTIFFQKLYSYNKKYVVIVDAGIQQNTSYQTYTEGLAQNVYINSPYNMTPQMPTVGKVWPGNCTFVDWLNPNASSFWLDQLEAFQNIAPFAGLWTDMNEVSNLASGEVGHNPDIYNITTMPYSPGGVDINYHSLDTGAFHFGGIQEYNIHSLFGYYESKLTSTYFTSSNERAFVLTRSSFPGTGRYAAKWTGDNFSQWNMLQLSIPGIFNFGMYGIPMIGADICGFNGNTNEELCSRWMQLGTLYPFSRNHNSIGQVPQEPWAFGPMLLETSIQSIQTKYLLYLYFYTQMSLLNSEGGSFFKPAYFEYPNDMNLLYNSSTSFMLGRALIVHPCIWQGIQGSDSYFPDDIWYNLFTGDYIFLNYENNAYLDMPLPGLVNIHVSRGHIIPTLDSYTTAQSAYDTRYSNISLTVTLGGHNDAYGSIIFDDGISTNGYQSTVEYQFFTYNSTFDMLSIQELSFGYTRQTGEWPFISTIILYGCTAAPESVFKFSKSTLVQIPIRVYWNAENQICKIWLKNYLQPDELSVLYIDYFI